MRNRLTVLFLFLLVSVPASASRIAVLTSPDAQDAGAALTDALSSTTGIEVLERADLTAIAREQGLVDLNASAAEFGRVGRVLGADILVILDHPAEAGNLYVRVIAVGPGVIVSDDSFAWPLKDPPGWSTLVARRVSSSASQLPDAPGRKTLLGVLGIRSAFGGGPTSQYLGREAPILVNYALGRLPDVFVLERARLRESDWEKQISSTVQTSYWASAWLIDGSIAANAQRLIFEGRLQAMGRLDSRPLHAEAADLPGLAQAIAAAVAQTLKLPAAVSTGPSPEELKQFQAEAEWAFRWKEYTLAERAADASWALGNRSEDLALLRARIPLEAAATDDFISAIMVPGGDLPPSVWDRLVRGISNLDQFFGSAEFKGHSLSDRSLDELSAALEKATDILVAYYYLPRPLTADEANALRKVRERLRFYFPIALEGCRQRIARFTPREEKNSATWGNDPPFRIFFTYGMKASYLGDTVEKSLDFFANALRWVDAFDPVHTKFLKRQIIVDRSEFHPIGVAWDPQQRPRISPLRDQFLRKMEAAGGLPRLYGLTFGFLRYYHPTNEILLRRVPKDVAKRALDHFADGLWEMRNLILNGSLEPEILANCVHAHIEAARAFGFAEDDHLFRVRLLAFLLENRWKGPQGLYGSLRFGDEYTPEEFATLRELMVRFQTQDPSPPPYLFYFIRDLTLKTSTSVSPTPSPTPQDGLAPSRVFPITYLDRNTILATQSLGNTIWLLLYHYGSVTISEIDTADGRQKLWQIEGGPELASVDNFAADEKCFYFACNEKVFRFDRASGRLDSRPVPAMGKNVGGLWVVKGALYISVAYGGIIQVDPVTLESQLLASARRKPALTLLDDQGAYQVVSAFPGRDGIVQFALRDTGVIYAWIPARKNFLKVFSGIAFSRNVPLDRDLMWRWIEAGASPEAHIFLLAANAQGLLSISQWPLKVVLDGETYQANEVYGAAVVGDRLYCQFHARDGRRKLAALSRNYQPQAVIPVNLPSISGKFSLARMVGCDNGLLFFDKDTEVKEVCFFSKTDLENFQPR